MALELDFIPALANLEGTFVENDISFLAFNFMVLGNDGLNTEEHTFAQDDGGRWILDKI